MPSLHEARLRHAKHFEAVLREAEARYLQSDESIHQGLSLFEQESKNIYAAQSWTASNAGNDGEAAQLCNNFGSAATSLLTRRFPADQAIAWLEAARDAANQLNKKYEKWGHLANLGNLYTVRGNIAQAIVYYEECLQVIEELGERARRGKGVILGQMGTAYYSQNQIEKAITCYKEQLAIAREYKVPQEISAALGNLGRAHRANKQFDKAIAFLEEALKITRESGDLHGEGITLGSLGQAYFDLKNPPKAVEYHEEYLVLMRRTGDRQSECTALGGLAHAYHASGDTPKAIECSEDALKISQEMNSRREESRAFGTLGYFHHSLRLFEKAIELYNAGLVIAEEIGDRQYVISAHSGLGFVCMALKKYEEAFSHFKVLYEYYYEIKDVREQGLTLYNCSICAANVGDVKKAIEFAETSANMLSYAGDPAVAKARELLANLQKHIAQKLQAEL